MFERRERSSIQENRDVAANYQLVQSALNGISLSGGLGLWKHFTFSKNTFEQPPLFANINYTCDNVIR